MTAIQDAGLAATANKVSMQLIEAVAAMPIPEVTREVRAVVIERLNELTEQAKKDQKAIASARRLLRQFEDDAPGAIRRMKRRIDVERNASGRESSKKEVQNTVSGADMTGGSSVEDFRRARHTRL